MTALLLRLADPWLSILVALLVGYRWGREDERRAGERR